MCVNFSSVLREISNIKYNFVSKYITTVIRTLNMAKKLSLSYHDIENTLRIFKEQTIQPEEVGFNLLKAFGKTDADIRRYKDGKGVLKSKWDLLIKGLVGYHHSDSTQLTSVLEELKKDPQVIKAMPKIVCVSDGCVILAYDMREGETYENPLNRLYCDFAFFYPLAGVERFHPVEENPADVKAAEKLAKLHDELRAYNEFSTDSDLHDLNIFIARLLFCFFAEDTGIFEPQLFTGSIVRYTKEDGSDLAEYLDEAFRIMDQKERGENTLHIISQFPYVNGGLFSRNIHIPNMGYKSRQIIIECGELNWQDINPDIFGSMIQAVVNPDVRANQGMHYTSVPNILKVINPLFMDELREEYNQLRTKFEELKNKYEAGSITHSKFLTDSKPIYNGCTKLLLRMSKMKFFDPACGSGNFLIITYKMLRLLEMDIIRLQQQIDQRLDFVDGSCIMLSQFYGIELLDFPHEIAMLSLWLAEHQMNKKFHENFGVNPRALPLHTITQIVCGNACRLDWNTVCPHKEDEEVFVFGNPPYLGSSMQDESQKDDLTYVCGHFKNYKNLDYIANWFYLGSSYIQDSVARCAFVTTNSICQGDSVALLWPNIFEQKNEIGFAYQSFKWSNNAKYNATVNVVIIGLQKKSNSEKFLYDKQNLCVRCTNINAYLLNAPDLVITRCPKSISDFPEMVFGNKPTDNGYLILDPFEKEELLKECPQAAPIIRKYQGAESFINGTERFCLWISKDQVDFAYKIPIIKQRLDAVRDFRLKSKAESTVLYADRPYLFKQRAHKETTSILVPGVSSEKRKYIPIGIFNNDTIIANTAQVIYNADIFIWGILSSHLNVVWASAIGGKLEARYRYTSLVYNSFPFPTISEEKKQEISDAAEEVLLTRADYPEKTLAELYDPDSMPAPLLEAHQTLDDIVESCYPGYPFANDEARLECLFKMYEKMTAKK